MQSRNKIELMSIHSLSFNWTAHQGERERDSDKNVERIQDERKENARLFLFKTHLFTHSTFSLALTAHTRTKKKDMVTIIKIKYYCFCSFVVTVLFVNLLYSSYLHFQNKLDSIMQECINAHIILYFFSRKDAVFAKATSTTSNDGIFFKMLKTN